MKFLSLLAILLIGLKLTNCITWSWWLVLMPLYLIPAITIVLCLILILIASDKTKTIITLITQIQQKLKNK